MLHTTMLRATWLRATSWLRACYGMPGMLLRGTADAGLCARQERGSGRDAVASLDFVGRSCLHFWRQRFRIRLPCCYFWLPYYRLWQQKC